MKDLIVPFGFDVYTPGLPDCPDCKIDAGYLCQHLPGNTKFALALYENMDANYGKPEHLLKNFDWLKVLGLDNEVMLPPIDLCLGKPIDERTSFIEHFIGRKELISTVYFVPSRISSLLSFADFVPELLMGKNVPKVVIVWWNVEQQYIFVLDQTLVSKSKWDICKAVKYFAENLKLNTLHKCLSNRDFLEFVEKAVITLNADTMRLSSAICTSSKVSWHVNEDLFYIQDRKRGLINPMSLVVHKQSDFSCITGNELKCLWIADGYLLSQAKNVASVQHLYLSKPGAFPDDLSTFLPGNFPNLVTLGLIGDPCNKLVLDLSSFPHLKHLKLTNVLGNCWITCKNGPLRLLSTLSLENSHPEFFGLEQLFIKCLVVKGINTMQPNANLREDASTGFEDGYTKEYYDRLKQKAFFVYDEMGMIKSLNNKDSQDSLLEYLRISLELMLLKSGKENKPVMNQGKGWQKAVASDNRGGKKSTARNKNRRNKPTTQNNNGGTKPLAQNDSGRNKAPVKQEQSKTKPSSQTSSGRNKPPVKQDNGRTRPLAQNENGRNKPVAKPDNSRSNSGNVGNASVHQNPGSIYNGCGIPICLM